MSLTTLAFLGTYAAGLIAAFSVHPRWGLYTYIALFYLHPPMRWWGHGLPELRWSLIAALVTFVATMQTKPNDRYVPWLAHPLPKLLLAYVVWMWVQVVWANPMHLEGTILFSKYILLFFLVYRLTETIDDLKAFAVAHVLGCGYFGLLALDASGTGRLEYIGGPGVFDSNTLGMHVSTAVLFGGALFFATKGWMRWVVLVCAPLIANTILQTESRGAFLGVVVGGAAFYYFAPRVRKGHILLLGALCVTVLLARSPEVYWERIATIGAATDEEEELDSSAQSRIVVAKAQLRMFSNYPLGLGHRTTAYLSRQYIDPQWLTAPAGSDRATHGSRSSHATILSVMTDQGIPGILIATAGALTVLLMMWRLRRMDKRDPDGVLSLFRAAICGSLVTILVAGLFTNYFKAEIQIWSLALLLAVYRISLAFESHQSEQAATGSGNDEARPPGWPYARPTTPGRSYPASGAKP